MDGFLVKYTDLVIHKYYYYYYYREGLARSTGVADSCNVMDQAFRHTGVLCRYAVQFSPIYSLYIFSLLLWVHPGSLFLGGCQLFVILGVLWFMLLWYSYILRL